MKKIIAYFVALWTIGIYAFTLIPLAHAASVTVDNVATVCKTVIFAGTAVYNPATELLRIKHGGGQVASFTTGAATWSIETAVAGTDVTAEVVTIASGVVSASASDTFAVNCGGTDPFSVMQIWGLTGHQTPKSVLGQVLTDEFGITEACTYFIGCMDIRKTDYYRLPILKLLGR